MVRSASIKNQAKPLIAVTKAAKSNARLQPILVATAAVITGDARPPRLPNVVIIPEMDPDDLVEMSLQVVHKTAEAAKLNPAASVSCTRAKVLLTVWLPDHSNSAEHAIPSHAVVRRPRRLPSFSAARSESQPHRGTKQTFATKGAEPQKPAFDTVTPRTFTR